jgi:hypothetical protein
LAGWDLHPLESAALSRRTVSKVFKVAPVRDRYNRVDRGSEAVLESCEKQASASFHGFRGRLASLPKSVRILTGSRKRTGAAPSQISIASVLKRRLWCADSLKAYS